MLNAYPDRFLFGTDTVAPRDRQPYFTVFDLWAPVWRLLTPEASVKVRIGNYERTLRRGPAASARVGEAHVVRRPMKLRQQTRRVPRVAVRRSLWAVVHADRARRRTDRRPRRAAGRRRGVREVTRTLKEGKNADYIPALAKVDPNLFGIAVVTADGKVYTAGDIKTEVSIQSISKVFTMAQVIQEQGMESIEKRSASTPRAPGSTPSSPSKACAPSSGPARRK